MSDKLLDVIDAFVEPFEDEHGEWADVRRRVDRMRAEAVIANESISPAVDLAAGQLPMREDDRALDVVTRREAQPRRSWLRPRRGVVVLIVLMALLVPVVGVGAIGANKGWWLSDRTGIVPIGEVVVVQTGEQNGVTWTLNAFRTDRLPHRAVIPGEQLLCFGVSHGHATQAGGGFLARGPPPDPSKPQIRRNRPMPELRWIRFGQTQTSKNSARWIVGTAAPEVKAVILVLSNGDTVLAPTIPAPDALGTAVNFYVYIAQPPCAGPVREFIPLDTAGQPLEPSQRPAPPITTNPDC